jgi:TolA-binding protein
MLTGSLRKARFFSVAAVLCSCVVFSAESSDIALLEENVRFSNGKIEELEKKVADLQTEIELLKNAFRRKETDDASKANLDLIAGKTPKELLSIACDLIDENKRNEARSLLKLYLEKNPTSDYCGIMKFYIGESYFREEKYEYAAKEYIDGFKDKPRGEKSAETLYKLGLCFKKLSKIAEADATFNKLINTFPDAVDLVKKAKKERSGGK